MSLNFSQSDRTYMRNFFIGIVMLGVVTAIEITIATLVWSSHTNPSDQRQVAVAGARIAPVAAVYAGNNRPAAPEPSAAAVTAAAGPYSYDAAQGKSLFDSTCAACHQASGEGIAGTFPPLKGNPAVDDADPASQIETILQGRHGTVIDGKKYSGVMPPFAAQLSDLQVADIANYERSAWGNHAKHVTPAEVAAIRAKAK